MYLKNEAIVVNIGRETFRSHAIPSTEFILDPTAIIGWYDGVSVRRENTVRPNSWGDFSEKGRFSSRSISLSGTAVVPRTPAPVSTADLHELRDRFMSILNNGDYGEIEVIDSSGIKYATVGLDSAPAWIVRHDTVATWKLDLYAPDPRIYGIQEELRIGDSTPNGGLLYPLSYPLNYHTPNASVTSQVISNNGNTESWPQFKVTGVYPTGFTVTNNRNKKVVYTGLVTMESPVTIDMARGTAFQNGVDKTSLVSVRDWFSIPAKSSIRPSFTTQQDGTGWCDVFFRDTWI